MSDVAWYWLRPVQVDGEPYVLHAFPGRELYAPAVAATSATIYMVACRRFVFLPPAKMSRDDLPPLERCLDCAIQMAQAKADGITVYAPLARDLLMNRDD
jgi:hypothetical protein